MEFVSADYQLPVVVCSSFASSNQMISFFVPFVAASLVMLCVLCFVYVVFNVFLVVCLSADGAYRHESAHRVRPHRSRPGHRVLSTQ